MAITKRFLAQQIVHAEQGFKKFSEMSIAELRDGYHRQNELEARFSKKDLFELRDKVFKKYS